MRYMGSVLALLCVLLLPGTGSAQVAWDAPLMLPPAPPVGVGRVLMDMSGGGLGFMFTWQSSTENYGLRGGIADGNGRGNLALFGGVTRNGDLSIDRLSFLPNLGWVYGAGFGVGSGVQVSIPVGVSFSHLYEGDGVVFKPYATPRAVADGFFGGARTDSDVALGFALDLGLDVHLSSALTSAGFLAGAIIRLGTTLGDRNAIGIGLVY
jgi:hypothetical protein